MEQVNEILSEVYYGNTGYQWLIALLINLFFCGLAAFFYFFFAKWMLMLTANTETEIDDILIDMLEEPLTVVIIAFGVRLTLDSVTLPTLVNRSIDLAYQFLLAIMLVWFVFRFIEAVYKEATQSVTYLVASKAIMLVLFFVSILFMIRYWITLPANCYPNCIGENLIGRNMVGLDLNHGNFVEASLRGSNMSNTNLTGADFSGADLTGVNLGGANLQGAKFLGANLAQVDLRDTSLSQASFNGAVLIGADLTRADLRGVDLQGVILNNAKLVGANLNDQHLNGVDMPQADLTGAYLNGASLNGARLSGSTLSSVELDNAELAGSWLNLADLTGAKLNQTNLAGSSLLGAKLVSVELRDSNLAGSVIIGANLSGANLRGANLSGMRVFKTEINAIDLQLDAIIEELNELQLSQVSQDGNLKGVQFNSSTQWPLGKIGIIADMLGQDVSSLSTAVRISESDLLNTLKGQAPDNQEFSEQGRVALLPITPTNVVGNISIMQDETLASLVNILNRAFQDGGYQGNLRILDMNTETETNPYCSNQTIDILLTTRYFTPEELEICAKNNKYPIPFRFGTDSVVIAVNPLNSFLSDATVEELAQIFQAERWVDVNSEWPSEPIHRFVPTEDSGTYEVFSRVVFKGRSTKLSTAAHTTFSQSNVQLVEQIALNPYGIGFFSHTFYQQNAQALRLLNLNGVSSTDPESIDNEQYPLVQPLIIYVDRDKLQTTPDIAAIIRFYLIKVNKVIDLMGYFPISSLSFDKTEVLFLNTLGYQ